MQNIYSIIFGSNIIFDSFNVQFDQNKSLAKASKTTVSKVKTKNFDYKDWYEVVVERRCVVLHIIRYSVVWNEIAQVSRKEQEAQHS